MLINTVSIIFVHSGERPPPHCMATSVAVACEIAPKCNVLVLVNESNLFPLRSQLQSQYKYGLENLQIITIESLSEKNLSTNFTKDAKADRDFRGGFWLHTANRFMLIADLMDSLCLENCLHLENDNILYFDPSHKLEVFRSHASFAIPFDRSRAIPGIVWYKNSQIAQDLAKYIRQRSEMHDFDVLRQFCDSGLYDAKPLPTMPPAYAKARGFSVADYCAGYEHFGGIFDAAAIGQYIGGVDPRNIPGDSRFFINETSDLDISQCDLIWSYQNGHRNLYFQMDFERVKVLSVHAHSKDTLGASPFNFFSIENEGEVITGERIQECAEITIASKEAINFHGLDNIRSNEILQIPKKESGNFFRKKLVDTPPDEKWFDNLKNVKTIFVYTHLLDYFRKYVLPRLESPFNLITHNSDDGITFSHIDILNHHLLVKWFGQNCEISHKKLIPLPIGVTNRQWGAQKIVQLLKVSREYEKSKLAYANFRSDTHPNRGVLLDIISDISWVTKSQDLGYTDYLAELAQHQFCLCPRGNGIDTHRFWEAQYLNTIPIIVKSDWTAAYSGLPVLVLDDWTQLIGIDLRKEFIKISTTFLNLDSLSLYYYNI
ncbi:glycosyltransferase family 47 protein [Polynucleobacter sp. UB-Siik-W21]|uniref:glycosyltransferase family 47 protein n=1 Tax=Polynucleobacter sp. UB-Siik-W21 TaxID=1855646 RepID=UPI001BFEA984|nr:glycosyltransferase family 47 protein [Polynucleobacter sp. UB-Siik-W21]QWD70696.1 hypothetical protein C2756_01580 [Polynucleobacter sp. UB-Siik-W21]